VAEQGWLGDECVDEWCLLFGLIGAVPRAAAGTVNAVREGWQLQSACKLQATATRLPRIDFKPMVVETAVHPALLARRLRPVWFPILITAMNLRQIPARRIKLAQFSPTLPMAQDSPYRCGWWYRTEFTAPAAVHQGERQWLHFGGINYRGDVWLNGRRLRIRPRSLVLIALTISMLQTP